VSLRGQLEEALARADALEAELHRLRERPPAAAQQQQQSDKAVTAEAGGEAVALTQRVAELTAELEAMRLEQARAHEKASPKPREGEEGNVWTASPPPPPFALPPCCGRSRSTLSSARAPPLAPRTRLPVLTRHASASHA